MKLPLRALVLAHAPAENASESHEDKPFAAASRLTAKAARDYTKWPEVKALPGVDVEPSRSHLGRRHRGE